MWTAERPTPSASREVVLAAWRVSRRATESAPPEMATQRRSPGWMCSREKGSVGGIASMLVGRRWLARQLWMRFIAPKGLSVFLLFACGCYEGSFRCLGLDSAAEIFEVGRLGG